MSHDKYIGKLDTPPIKNVFNKGTPGQIARNDSFVDQWAIPL